MFKLFPALKATFLFQSMDQGFNADLKAAQVKFFIGFGE